MESIYNLVPEPVVVKEKPPMYRSKHDPKAAVAGSTFGTHGTTQLPGAGRVQKLPSATFGPSEKTNPNPRQYLKKGEHCEKAKPRRNEPTNFKYPSAGRKPEVPRMEDKPVMGLRTTKNFITANAVEAILQVPQGLPEPEPDYLSKADYGQVPSYLSQVKEEIRRENDMIDAYVAEMGRLQDGGTEDQVQLTEMDEDERRALLSALKRKWDSVNANYQKLTHQVNLDTAGKIKRKETMERELEQIEADIEKLENRGAVYVAH